MKSLLASSGDFDFFPLLFGVYGQIQIERFVFISNWCLLRLHRQQDVRATEIDKVDMHLSFRAGDIVRAMVVSFSQL